MKKMKKIFAVILTACMLLATTYSTTFAAETKRTLDIVRNSSETKYLENDQGYITKTIVNSNPDDGEVTVELKLSNMKKSETIKNGTEIFLVIDNSGSMDFTTAEGETRKNIIIDAAKELVNSVYNINSDIQMGVIRFYSSAKVMTALTNDKSKVISSLDSIKGTKVESGTNIQKSIQVAKNNFSSENKQKIIVLLTDGLPNYDANNNSVGNSGMVMSNTTYQKILTNTKNELLNCKSSDVTLISLMTGVNSGDLDSSGNAVTSTEEDLQALETIFGTASNPTAGKFYNIKTTDVSNIINKDILGDIQEIVQNPIKDIKIVDYFPNDIASYFDFEFVDKSNMGTVTDKMDSETSTIEWNIDTLEGNKEASIKYKLKLKDMNNTELLNKVISTNEKVVLTYKDKDDKDYTVVLDSSPQIKLVQKEVQDNTATNSRIPNAGINSILCLAATISIILLIVSIIKSNKYKDVK